eukprot:jgi/Mesen1/2563/ME000162S01688
MDIGGVDSHGKSYQRASDMWREEAGLDEDTGDNGENLKRKDWYHKGVSYWEGVEASVDGVLGGYGHVSARDVNESTIFLRDLALVWLIFYARKLHGNCGAGVGRVTKDFLLHHFDEVDLVEPVEHFLEAARASLATAPGATCRAHRAAHFFCTPLQDFAPEAGRYDVVWVQWCIGHLTDADFVAFFQRAQAEGAMPVFLGQAQEPGEGPAGLKPGGIIVLKENNCRHGFVVDKEDSSVTRSDAYFRHLIALTGLHLHKVKLQRGFPKELFEVRMYALSPDEPPGDLSPAATPSQTRSAKKKLTKQNVPGLIR